MLQRPCCVLLVAVLLAGCGSQSAPPSTPPVAAPPPPTTRTFRTAADERAYSASNLKQLGLAVLQFAEKNGEKFSDLSSPETLRRDTLPFVLKNGGTEDIYTHPRTGEPYQPNSSLSGKGLADIAAPATTVLLFEASPSEGGTRGILFTDGHANRIAETEWPALKQASGMP